VQARQPGGADLFICFAGVQMREAVAAKADWTVFDFQELIAELP
jgi:phosphoserine phosphatase